jgi:hypothetical protein
MMSANYSFSDKVHAKKNKFLWFSILCSTVITLFLYQKQHVNETLTALIVFGVLSGGFLVDFFQSKKYGEAAFGVIVVKKSESPFLFNLRLLTGLMLSLILFFLLLHNTILRDYG